MTVFSTTDSQISQGLVCPMAPQVARLLPIQAVTATEFFPALLSLRGGSLPRQPVYMLQQYSQAWNMLPPEPKEIYEALGFLLSSGVYKM